MSLLFRERRAGPSPSEILSAATRYRGDGSTYVYSTAEAFQIAAVVACVGLRSGAFAQLPLKSYRDRDGVAELTPVQPELLVSPSPTVVPSLWKTQMSISRDIWGFAAGHILGVDAAGYPSKVEWFPPDCVEGWQDFHGGPLRWKIDNEEIDGSLVFHLPSRWVMPGSPLGVSPLAKSGLVELAKRAQDFGRDWFVNGAVPSAIIYSEQELNSSQADDISERVAAKWRGRKPAVMDSRLKYEQVSVNANESQFIETMRQVAADIAVSFNLPPEKINAVVSGQSVTYANREQNVQQYLMDSINPDLVVIQEVVERYMAPPTFPRWATGAFLRTDLQTRYASYKVGLEAGFLEVDEVRAWEELSPIDPVAVEPVVMVEPEPVVAVEEPRELHVHVDARSEHHHEPPVWSVDARSEHHHEPPVWTVDARSEHSHRHDGAQVNVNMPASDPQVRATVKRIEHDAEGRIVAIHEEGAV